MQLFKLISIESLGTNWLETLRSKYYPGTRLSFIRKAIKQIINIEKNIKL